MQCDVDTGSLNLELDFLSSVLKDRDVQPPTLHCKVAGGRMTMSSFDGFTNLSTSIPVTNAKDGTVCASPKVFRPLAKLLPKGNATIRDHSERELGLEWPDGVALLPKARPWLLRPPVGQGIEYTLPAKTLGDMVRIADFCIDEAAKSKIPGVLLEITPGRLRLVASNIYALAIVERPIETSAEGSIVLPYPALASIRGLLNQALVARVGIVSDYVTVTTDTRSLVTRATAERFPSYLAILPKAPSTPATFHVPDMANAIHRVNLSSDNNPYGQVTLRFTTDAVHVTSDACRETLSANYDGAPYEVTFDMKKLKGLIVASKHERMTLNAGVPTAPQLFQPFGSTDEQLVLVPIRKR